MMVAVPLDSPRAAALLGRLAEALYKYPGELEKVMVMALNKVGANMRAEAVRMLAERYTAKVSDIRRKLGVTKASRKSPVVLLRGEGRPIHLGRWPGGPAVLNKTGRYLGVGAEVEILKGSGRRFVKGGFRGMSSKNWHLLVFKREGKPRYPVKALYGPSMIGYLSNPRHRAGDLLENMARTRLELELQRAAQYRLKELGAL
jgi:hypothetical protein